MKKDPNEEITVSEDDSRSLSRDAVEETESHMIDDQDWKENLRKAYSILGRPQAS